MPAANVLKAIYVPVSPAAKVDIVVVHGMNPLGNAKHEEDVWTDKTTGTNWVRTLLPQAIPTTRILAYEDNANIVFDSSTPGVAGQTRNLLECPKLKPELLEKAEESRQAEITIMEVKDWAIDLLNGQQRAALLAADHLRQSIDRIELQNIHEQCLPLAKAKLLQQEIRTLVIRNTQNIHERQIKYQEAESIVKRTEEVEKEVEGKDKKETYEHLAGEVASFWSSWCPEACIIL